MMSKRLSFWWGCSLSVLLGLNPLFALAAQTEWYLLKKDGHPIGQVRVQSYPQSQRDAHRLASSSEKRIVAFPGKAQEHPSSTRITEVENINHYLRQGEAFPVRSFSRFEENESSGAPLAFQHQYELGSQGFWEAQGAIADQVLDLRLVQENTVSTGQMPLMADGLFYFPAGENLERLYQRHYHDPMGGRFRFQTLSLGARPEVVETEVQPLQLETPGGPRDASASPERATVRKYSLRNPANPSQVVYEWRKAKGKLYKSTASALGALELVRVSQRAVREAAATSLDVVTASEIPTQRIAFPRTTTEALYRLTPLQGRVLDWAKVLPPDTAWQRRLASPPALTDPTSSALSAVASKEAMSAAVTVNSELVEGAKPLYLTVKAQAPANTNETYPISYQARYLQSTPYLQSDDPTLVQTAARIAGDEKRAYQAAVKLQNWVYQHITQKELSLGFASAKETLERQAGDCTEHAVLLAALVRALGIPSRVAMGLVYIPSTSETMGRFVYHMWTEVYIGKPNQGDWTPLDATNPQAIPDATHIQLGHSALTERGDLQRLSDAVVTMMGQFRIDVLKAFSPTQSTIRLDETSQVLNAEISKVDLDTVDVRRLSRQAIQQISLNPQTSLDVNTVDGLFTRGMESLGTGDVSQAKQYFEQAMGKLRQPVEFYRMGERLAAIEMYSLARLSFEKAAQLSTELTPWVNGWYRSYLPAHDLPEALEQSFLRAIYTSASASEDTVEMEFAAKGSSKKNVADDVSLSAKERLQQIVSQVPDFAPAYRHLAELSDGATALALLQKAASLSPHAFQQAEALGDWQMTSKRYADAAASYAKAYTAIKGQAFTRGKPWLATLEGKRLLATGQAMAAKNSRDAAAWLMMGKGLRLQHRSEEAVKALNNAVAMNPALSEAMLLRFQTAIEAFDWDRVDVMKGKVVPLTGQSALAARLLGQTQIKTRQYAAAIKTLQRAISLAPTQAPSYLLLSQAYQRLAMVQKPPSVSTKPTRNLASAASSSTKTSASRPAFSATSNTLAAGSIQQAEAVLRTALTRVASPDDRAALSLALARLLLQRNQSQGALSVAQGVLAMDPLNETAYLIKGRAAFYLGKSDFAEESLKTAQALNPSRGETLTLLGHVAQEKGQDALALDWYQRASRLDPFAEETTNALKRLTAQMNLNVKKMPEQWYLSDDERDYLLQALIAVRRIQQQNLNYMREVSSLLGTSGHIPFSVQGVQTVQSFGPFLNTLYNNEQAIYQRLNAVTPPARFANLHYRIAMMVYQDLALYQQALPRFATLQTDRKAVEAYTALLNEGMTLRQNFTTEITGISQRLPVAVYQGLLLEARMTDMATLNQGMENTAKQVSETLTRQAEQDHAKSEQDKAKADAIKQLQQSQSKAAPAASTSASDYAKSPLPAGMVPKSMLSP